MAAKKKVNDAPPGTERCPRCAAAMMETHCKVMCVNCGYMRDCNDQW